MRIRSIKPEFYRSDDIDALDWHARLIFIALWSYVDDNGVGRDKLANIAADIFASDLSVEPTETLRRLSLGMDALQERSMIQRYTVNGKPFLYVTNWKAHQLVKNPNNERYPPPTCDNSIPTEALRTSSVEPTETLPTGTGEQGNRGAEEQGTSSSTLAVAPADQERDDARRICHHLADSIEHNGSKRPTVTKGWLDAARLMLDRDGRDEQQIHQAIDWCQADEFWRTNILSMPKLREKYDQLRLKATQASRPRPGSIDWNAAMERARERDERSAG